MAFELPPLPYADNALEPHYSANTFSFHHAKHHNAYVVNLNKLIEGSDLAGKSLEEIIMASAGDGLQGGRFQQRRAGLESHLLLEFHVPERRRPPER